MANPVRARDDIRSLSGSEKAAVLMLAIGEEQTTKVFALMDDEEIKDISQAMAKLGTVSADIVEKLFVEFADQISSTGALIGSFESTERLLGKALTKERVSSIMEAVPLEGSTPPNAHASR